MVEYYKISNFSKHANLNRTYPDLYDGVGSTAIGDSISVEGGTSAALTSEGHSTLTAGPNSTLGLMTGTIGDKETVGKGKFKGLKARLFIDDISKEQGQTQNLDIQAFKLKDNIADYGGSGDVRVANKEMLAFTARQNNFVSEQELFTGNINSMVGNDTEYTPIGKSLIISSNNPYLDTEDAEEFYRYGTDKGLNQQKKGGGGIVNWLDSNVFGTIKKRHGQSSGKKRIYIKTVDGQPDWWETKKNRGFEPRKYFKKGDVQGLVKFDSDAPVTVEVDENYANAASPNNTFFDSISQGKEITLSTSASTDNTLVGKAEATFSSEAPSGHGQQLKLHAYWSGTTDEAGTGAPDGTMLGDMYTGNHSGAGDFEDRQEVRLSYHTVPYPAKIFPDGWNCHPVLNTLSGPSTALGGQYGDTQLPYSSVVSMKVNFAKLESGFVPDVDQYGGSTTAEKCSVTKRAFVVTFGYFQPRANESLPSYISRHANKGSAISDGDQVREHEGFPFFGFSFVKKDGATSTAMKDGIYPVSSDYWYFEDTAGKDDYIFDSDAHDNSGGTDYGAHGSLTVTAAHENSGNHVRFTENEYVNLDFHFSPDVTYCGLVMKDEKGDSLKILDGSGSTYYKEGFHDYHNEGSGSYPAVFRSYNFALANVGETLSNTYSIATTTNTLNPNNQFQGMKWWDQFDANDTSPSADRDYFGASGSQGISSGVCVWPSHMSIWLCNWKNEIDADLDYAGSPEDDVDYYLHANGGLIVNESKKIKRATESKVYIDKIEFRNFNYEHQNASVCERNVSPQMMSIGGGDMVDAMPMSFDAEGLTSAGSAYPQPWTPRDLGSGFQWPSNTILGFATNEVSGATSLNPGSTSSGANQHHILMNGFKASLTNLEQEYTISDWDNSGSDSSSANTVTISLPKPQGINTGGIPQNQIIRWDSSNDTYDDIAAPKFNIFTSSGDKITWGTNINTSGAAVNNMTGKAYEIGPPLWQMTHSARAAIHAETDIYNGTPWMVTSGDQNSTNQTPAFGQQFSGMSVRTALKQDATNGISYYANNKINTRHTHLVDNFTNKGGIQLNGDLVTGIDHDVTVANSEMVPELVRREHCAFSAKVLKCINKSEGIYKVDTTVPFRVPEQYGFVAYLHGGAFTAFNHDLEDGDDTSAGGGGTVLKKNIKIVEIIDNKHIRLDWGGMAEDGTTELSHEEKLPYLWICPAAFYLYGVFPNYRGRSADVDNPMFIDGLEWQAIPIVQYKSAILLKATSGHTSAEGTTGATYNEYTYSDTPSVTGFQENQWSIEPSAPDTALDVMKDFGFGAYDVESDVDNEKQTAGIVGRTYGVVANKHADIEMPKFFEVQKHFEGGEEVSFLFTPTIETVSHKAYYRTPSFDSSNFSDSNNPNLPQLWTVYEDDIPEKPTLKIEPDPDSSYYPHFKIEASADDLWYGMILLDSQPIYDQYHHAVWRFGFKTLAEGGRHDEIIKDDADYISNFYNASWDKNFSKEPDEGATVASPTATYTNRGTRWYQTAKTETPAEFIETSGDPKVAYDGLGGPAIRFDGNDEVTLGCTNQFLDASLGGTIVLINDIDSTSGTATFTTDRAHNLSTGDRVFISGSGDQSGMTGAITVTSGTAFTCATFQNGTDLSNVTNDSTSRYLRKVWGPGMGYDFDGTGEFTLLMHVIPDAESTDWGYTLIDLTGSPLRLRTRDSQIVTEILMGRAGRFDDGEASNYQHTGTSYVQLSGPSIIADGKTPTMIGITIDPKLPEGNAKLYVNGALVDQTGPILDPTTNFDSNYRTVTLGIDAAQPGWLRGYDMFLNKAITLGKDSGGFKGLMEDVVVMNKCAYFITPGETETTLPINLKDINENGNPKNYNAKLFIKDYHNIQGVSPNEVACSPNISWRKAGFNLK